MTITPEEIAEWRKVCEGATSGEWEVESGIDEDYDAVTVMEGNRIRLIAGEMESWNADFITTASTAMPRLLDELAAKDALIATEQQANYAAVDRIHKLEDAMKEARAKLNVGLLTNNTKAYMVDVEAIIATALRASKES